MKKLYSVVLGMVLLICFSSVAAAKGNDILEISTFYNGSYQLSAHKSVIVNKNTTYVPLKLIDNFSDISVTYGSPITVKTGKGTFKIDKRNTIIHSGTTYITFKKLQEMSHINGRLVASAGTLFLWDHAAGKAESDRLIMNISKLSNGYRFQFGQKIHELSGTNKEGWIIDIAMNDYTIAVLKVLHKDYTTSEIRVSTSGINQEYMLDIQYQYLKKMFEKKYLWINRNELKDGNLKNLEKVYVQSINLKDTNFRLQVKRQNGTNYTISIPLGYDWIDALDEKFYFENPKSQFKWSSKVWDDISKQVIRIGMNSTQVWYSWGSPDDTSETINGYYNSKLWIYDDTYLYFSNDILKSISEY